MNYLEHIVVTVQNVSSKIQKAMAGFWEEYAPGFLEPTLEETLVEKIGGGPHGYGDPADTAIREEEKFLLPLMVWKKVRFEKCGELVEKYYECVNRTEKDQEYQCQKEEDEMFLCKKSFYNPEKIDELEKECIIDYVKLRSEFRKTGSDDDLWKMKMLMLHPGFNHLREAYKENESYEKMREGKSRSSEKK